MPPSKFGPQRQTSRRRPSPPRRRPPAISERPRACCCAADPGPSLRSGQVYLAPPTAKVQVPSAYPYFKIALQMKLSCQCYKDRLVPVHTGLTCRVQTPTKRFAAQARGVLKAAAAHSWYGTQRRSCLLTVSSFGGCARDAASSLFKPIAVEPYHAR